MRYLGTMDEPGDNRKLFPRVRGIYLVVAIGLWVVGTPAAVWPKGSALVPQASGVLGTWAGRSICVGDRPACKNEDVVYRIIAVEGRANLVTLLADKIIEGKRVPMGKLEFDYKAADGTLSSEFTRGQTHGRWEFKVKGDTITGTLIVLPDRSLARQVSVRRVKDSEVPDAPPLTEYQ